MDPLVVRNILLAVGLLALIAGVSLVGLWLSQGPNSPSETISARSLVASQEPTVDHSVAPENYKYVLTAMHPISSGTLLRSEDVTWKAVPSSEVAPSEVLRDSVTESDYIGALTRRDFVAGDMITADALLKPSDRGFLSATLSPGSRAVSIDVQASQSASGLLLPNDRVDIILTQAFEQSAGLATKFVGEIVLENIRVIAVDRWLGSYKEIANGTASTVDALIPKTVTLEVSPRQAQMLMVANRLGKVDVAVRSLERSNSDRPAFEQPSSPIWASDVSPVLKELGIARVQPLDRAAQVQRRPPIVEVIRGSNIEDR